MSKYAELRKIDVSNNIEKKKYYNIDIECDRDVFITLTTD